MTSTGRPVLIHGLIAYCTAKCLGSQTKKRRRRGTRFSGTEGYLRFLTVCDWGLTPR